MASSGAEQAFFRPVRALPDEVARKIDAGEVIDRPAAVIRELIDNSIDSGATRITVEIAGGGAESIRVTDNGHGMTADDLAICTHAHTTSKIAREDDLLSLATLGFRGEALSSIQAVSRLEITTTRDGRRIFSRSPGTASSLPLPAAKPRPGEGSTWSVVKNAPLAVKASVRRACPVPVSRLTPRFLKVTSPSKLSVRFETSSTSG